MIRRVTAAAIAAAALLLAGCGSDVDQPAAPPSTPNPAITEQADTCQHALEQVVEAIETSWDTASMAVTRAQEAAEAPVVDDCLDR